jgi:chloramphenicol-sensitive protein RarD
MDDASAVNWGGTLRAPLITAFILPMSLVSSLGMNDTKTAPPQSETRAGIASGLAAYLLWGSITVFWKLLSDFNAFELIGWRIVTAVVLLLALVTAQRRIGHVVTALRNPRLLVRIVAASLLLVTNWTLYVWAVVNEHIIETALGYFIAPLLTALLGVLVLGEKLRRLQKVALGFAVAAVVVLTFTYGQPPFVALAIAASWAVYGLLKKNVPLRPVDSLTAETLVLVPGAIGLMVWSFTRTDGIPTTASASQMVLVLLTGLITAVPLLFFAHSALRLPLTLIGPLQYLVPVINFLLGWLAYDEPLEATRFAGFLLVWCGLVFSLVDTMRSRAQLAPPTK